MQVDEATRETIVDMEKVRNEVLHTQSSEKLKLVTKDLADVLQVSYFVSERGLDR